MRKALVKTIIVAALLCYSNLKAKETNVIKKEKSHANQIIFSSNIIKKVGGYQIVTMYSLQNEENLKAYHIGLKFFDPSHMIPTEKDLAKSIQLHPYFIGSFPKELSQEEIVSFKHEANHPFFIFETCIDSKNDFYMVHKRGIRHFTIKSSDEKNGYIARLSNGTAKHYPNLEKFTKSTIESHTDEYLI